MAMDSFGQRLRTARERRGWSVDTLARQARVTPGTITRLEDNRITIVHGRKVPALARALAVDLAWLLDGSAA